MPEPDAATGEEGIDTMTINDYERDGGFSQELRLIREMGMALTALEEAVPARPFRKPELDALRQLRGALESLRAEICETRSMVTR